MLLVYFTGVISYWVSNAANTEQDKLAGQTFVSEFGLNELQFTSEKLITCCYFALTMLSTVGYGDLYPISQREMIFAVVIMLCGVTFFSYIMGVLFNNMTNYK